MPRSASRDLADRYVGNRGYFRQPDYLRRAKNWLALAALGLTAGWAVVDAGSLNRTVVEASHTHGTLASVHAPFDSNCEACHKPGSLDSLSARSVFHAGDRWLDLTCEKCHAGPAHHAKVVHDANGKSFNDRCENCHHDHGGRNNSLVRIADSICTNCHANLGANHAEGKYAAYPAAEKITGFSTAGGHPEFRELAEYPPEKGTPYPRGLKFSHALHMTPGQAYPNGGPLWRLKDFATASDRQRYLAPGQKDENNALVQLRCESCHQLDSGFAAPDQPGGEAFAALLKPLAEQPKMSILPPRAEGAYYLPVNFDAHCKACHPISAPAAKSGDTVIPSFPLSHRRQPAELKHVLQGEYAARLTFPDNPKAAPAGPGGRLDPRSPAGPAAFRDEAERLAEATLNTLLLGVSKAGQDPAAPSADGFRVAPSGYACGKCHYTDDPAAKPEARHIAAIPNKTVWFGHAMFVHDAHRATACAECHPGTTPAGGVGQAVLNEREPIQITGVASCQRCHSPAGGIRSGCTDCHRYHNGDHPLQGRGAISRDPAARLKVSEFLNGGR